MTRKISAVALITTAALGELISPSALAANSGVLAITVTVAEKCRIDFSEGSADFFQVCSSAPGVSNERSSTVLGSTIAVDPAEDPYYLDRNPDNPSREAAAALPQATARPPAPVRNGPKVVRIVY